MDRRRLAAVLSPLSLLAACQFMAGTEPRPRQAGLGIDTQIFELYGRVPGATREMLPRDVALLSSDGNPQLVTDSAGNFVAGRNFAFVPEGTSVSFTATVGQSSNVTFVGWYGEGCNGARFCRVTARWPATTVYPWLRRIAPVPPFLLSVTAVSAPDSVRIDPNRIVGRIRSVSGITSALDCVVRAGGNRCLLPDSSDVRSFTAPATVVLEAEALGNSRFLGWYAPGCGPAPRCTFRVEDHASLIASFSPRP